MDILTVTKSAAMKIRVQVFVSVSIFNHFVYIHRCIIGNPMFNFVRDHQTVFQ